VQNEIGFIYAFQNLKCRGDLSYSQYSPPNGLSPCIMAGMAMRNVLIACFAFVMCICVCVSIITSKSDSIVINEVELNPYGNDLHSDYMNGLNYTIQQTMT